MTPLLPHSTGERPQDMEKQRPPAPIRMSARLEEAQYLQERAVYKDRSTKQ